jgi:hypothetical protein
MKLQKVFLISLILVALQICFGQEKPKAELVDEFGKIYCEELRVRIDSFYQNGLGSSSSSTGYIVINGNKNNSLEKYLLEVRFKSAVGSQKYDFNRVVFVRGKDNDSTHGQFWLVPEGAEKPDFDEENWDYSLPELNKAVKFHERIWEDFDDICPSNRNFSEELYAKLLLGNPNFRGNIVISGNSSKNIKKELIKVFVNQYKIPANRLKFFYDKNGYPENVEYWIVPTKKK